jgi:hypothetical protein
MRAQLAGGVSLVVAAALAVPAAGGAARPRAVEQGYAPVGGVAAAVHAPSAQVVHGSALPFTGLDLGLIAAGGGGLLLLGGSLKRAGRE